MSLMTAQTTQEVGKVAHPNVHTTTVAVVGTGSIGMRHLEIFRRLPGIRVVAIPVRAERRGELKEQHYAVTDTLEDAVEQGARWCVVATDPGRHLHDASVALAKGCDVLVEKPMVRTAVEAQQLLTCVQREDRKLFVGCVLRFSESLGAFRERLPEVGTIHAVRIECQSYLPDWRLDRPYRASYSARADEGGVLRDLIHEIDYGGWIFGWPQTVTARIKNLGRLGIDAEELADVSWDAPRGCVVSIHLDYLTRPPRRRMVAYGSQGTIEWDGLTQEVTMSLAGRPPTRLSSSQTRDEMFLAQASAMLAAGRGSFDPRLATGEDGERALAICDAARQAALT